MTDPRRLVLWLVLLLGCGDGGAAAPADLGLSDRAVDLRPADAAVADRARGEGRPDLAPFIPTPAAIKFQALSPLPAGEQILFNDWNPDPNVVFSMTPDGQKVTKVFAAYRIWSLAVSRAGDRIAFACGDPLQAQHYGLTIGDAIQHSWLYDVGQQTAQVIATGNINDECHAFGPGDSALYVCRRYDFQPDGTNKGWRLGRIDLPATSFTFLTAEVPMEYHLGPQATPDGKTLYYGRIQIAGGKQQNAILRQALPSGQPEVVRQNANRPTLSPDGTRYVFQRFDDQRHLYVATLDGASLIKVAAAEGTTTRYSPDGKQIAYLVWEAAKNCAHIDVVKADGSEAQAPRRLRDCGKTGEFITELDWIAR